MRGNIRGLRRGYERGHISYKIFYYILVFTVAFPHATYISISQNAEKSSALKRLLDNK